MLSYGLALHLFCLVSAVTADETNRFTWSEELPGHKWYSSDKEVEDISSLTNFWSFSLESKEITDQGMQRFTNATNVTELTFHWTAVSDRGMKILSTLPNLSILSVDRMEVTGNTLAPLSNAKRLRSLYLDRITKFQEAAFLSLGKIERIEHLFVRDSSLDHSGFRGLQGLKKLASLDLSGTPVDADDLKHLSGSTQIKKLCLGHCPKLNNDALEPVGALTNLTWLSLAISSVSDEGISKLSRCTQLNTLILQDTLVTGTGLKHLKCSENMQYLTLTGCPLTHSGIAEIARFKRLRDLDLKRTPVSDVDLKHLKQLAALRSLNLYGTKVTEAGVGELQKALPKCNIEF